MAPQVPDLENQTQHEVILTAIPLLSTFDSQNQDKDMATLAAEIVDLESQVRQRQQDNLVTSSQGPNSQNQNQLQNNPSSHAGMPCQPSDLEKQEKYDDNLTTASTANPEDQVQKQANLESQPQTPPSSPSPSPPPRLHDYQYHGNWDGTYPNYFRITPNLRPPRYRNPNPLPPAVLQRLVEERFPRIPQVPSPVPISPRTKPLRLLWRKVERQELRCCNALSGWLSGLPKWGQDLVMYAGFFVFFGGGFVMIAVMLVNGQKAGEDLRKMRGPNGELNGSYYAVRGQ